MEVNSRKHQAFIKSKKNCPPSIRHQLLNILHRMIMLLVLGVSLTEMLFSKGVEIRIYY